MNLPREREMNCSLYVFMFCLLAKSVPESEWRVICCGPTLGLLSLNRASRFLTTLKALDLFYLCSVPLSNMSFFCGSLSVCTCMPSL